MPDAKNCAFCDRQRRPSMVSGGGVRFLCWQCVETAAQVHDGKMRELWPGRWGGQAVQNTNITLDGTAINALAEVLARSLSLPFPGPVVGMLLLLWALRWPLVREPVSACAEALLQHLSLLFVPVGVGVMTHLGLVSAHGLRMLAVIVLSTLAGLAATALVLRALSRTDEDAPELPPAGKRRA